MDFMLSCAAGLQNIKAGRVKRLQEQSKTLQDQKKAAGNAKNDAGRVIKLKDIFRVKLFQGKTL
ncbi:hypothetical protein D1164_00030 [Mariniphaga sediminis]|uniref:Uncharacterized protein n=1 Tax=Mariniphaga sediminis TaxID=1628158 RepID=A0A399D8Y7_9BACT|nr:hypothetical protein D1164_00030 [Mariniphaga sediminis]